MCSIPDPDIVTICGETAMNWFPRRCIVVPVDFSPASDRAVKTALSIAESPGCVHVVHVVTVPTFVPYGEGAWLVDTQSFAEKAKLYLREYLEKHPDFSGVQSATLTGEAADSIVRYAREKQSDLIIMPSHSRTGIRRLVLGSVTQNVLHDAPCEVLVQRFSEP